MGGMTVEHSGFVFFNFHLRRAGHLALAHESKADAGSGGSRVFGSYKQSGWQKRKLSAGSVSSG